MTRHKHYDVIVAWAEGQEIQVRHYNDEMWVDLLTDSPFFHLLSEYRIKPKTTKKEGWVNIYPTPGGGDMRRSYDVHATEEAAQTRARDDVLATVKIEWEETE